MGGCGGDGNQMRRTVERERRDEAAAAAADGRLRGGRGEEVSTRQLMCVRQQDAFLSSPTGDANMHHQNQKFRTYLKNVHHRLEIHHLLEL